MADAIVRHTATQKIFVQKHLYLLLKRTQTYTPANCCYGNHDIHVFSNHHQTWYFYVSKHLWLQILNSVFAFASFIVKKSQIQIERSEKKKNEFCCILCQSFLFYKSTQALNSVAPLFFFLPSYSLLAWQLKKRERFPSLFSCLHHVLNLCIVYEKGAGVKKAI